MTYDVKAEIKGDTLAASFDGVTLGGERPPQDGAQANASFVDGYLRKGLADAELKSVTGVTGAEGGFAIPREIDARIDAAVKLSSPLRRLARVVRVGSAGYRKLVTSNGVMSGWAGETDPRPATATPVFNEIVPPMGDLYANAAASQAMLDDAAFDVEGWLAQEIAAEFARAEGVAFVAGDGVNKPRGILTAPADAKGDKARAFGTLQYLATGATGSFGSAGADRLVDVVQSLKAPYRQGAAWVMNARSFAAVRKFKTADGAFLWQPSLVPGTGDTLLGYPVVEAEDMPDIAADACAIAFGNFDAGYLITERSETRIPRDPYSNKPFVYFYATKRIGGCVMNAEAIKLLKFGAN